MKQFFAILCSLLLAAGPALATLTATVSPGYQFSASERPTTATLNLLATPTITISGTVDGTTGLTPGSVSGTMLADSVSDTEAGSPQATLDWYSFGGGRALQIASGGVSWTQINTNALGRGLSGGYSVGAASGTNLNVNYDGTTITLNTNNELKIADTFLVGVFYIGGSYPITPGYTNAWGLTNAFAITNLYMVRYTNGVSTGSITNTPSLTDTDKLPVFSGPQGTNTTTTLAALASYTESKLDNLTITNLVVTNNLTVNGNVSWYAAGTTNITFIASGGNATNTIVFNNSLGTTAYAFNYTVLDGGAVTNVTLTKRTNSCLIQLTGAAGPRTIEWTATRHN